MDSGIVFEVSNKEIESRPIDEIDVEQLGAEQFAWLESSWEGRPPHFDLLIGNGWVRVSIDKGQPVDDMVARWQSALDRFRDRRQAYLLYDRTVED